MSKRHLLSFAALGQKNLIRLVNRSVDFALGYKEIGRPLEGKVIGIYFGKPSTRTRTSFTVGSTR
jgi:ornithine carbamoyltransferase